MPFTFSHPAFVLPFLRLPGKYISVTALMAGSIAPDFEYFLTMDVDGKFSHSPAGIFLFDLPVIFLISIIFHTVIRKPLTDHLPCFISSGFNRVPRLNIFGSLKKNFIVFSYSALAGLSSHLILDAFTHKNGYFVEMFPVFMTELNLFDHAVYLYRFLQHGLSIAGLGILLIAFYKLPRWHTGTALSNFRKIRFWAFIIVITSGIIFLRYYAGPGSERFGYWAVNLISAGFSALLLACSYYFFKSLK